MPDDNLKEQCLKLRAAAGEGEKWLADNSAHISNAENLRKRLRRAGRRLKSYAEAAGHKMGLAVFGPSQSGKSTLISNLGRGPDGSLNVRFGGEVLDFLTQVNPTGGNETTGLVTRFSLEPTPASPDAAHPVCLKLFSETDIVKILANTYFAEAKGALLISEEEMLAGLKALAARPAADSRLTLDDMEDLAEYVKNISETSAYGDLLERVYWGRAVDLGSRLDFDGRAALFSYLWGKVDEFTAIYKRLYKTLELLRFNETVFCELSALNEGGNEKEGGLGRKNSILHVDRLLGLLDDQAGETVSVVSRDGAKAALTRPVLSALTAEVHVQILEKTGDFMDKADLLDFPGYRSREKLTDIAEEIKKPETLKKCFLRGKVAYLFERCSARKEISAMLLCIGDSVQNNPDLPGMIDQWLREAHGQNAAERAGKKPSLFLVLTKFDATFEQGAGGADAMTRWETRYKASFLQFFGSYSWPAEWGMEDGRPAPFKNLFWLLNLHFGKSILEVETLDGDRDWYKAKRVLPARAVETQQLYEGYMEAPGTKKHFAEPRAAWEAVLGAEDGGVAYIANKLNPVLSVDLKSRQLTALAAAEAGVIEGALRDFYQGGDKDEERAVKEALAGKILAVLKGLALEKRRFGQLLRALQMSDDECRANYDAPLPEAGEAEKTSSPPAPAAPAAIDLDALLGFGPARPEAAAPPAPGNDAAGRFRRRVELAWFNRLDELAADARRQRYFSLPRELFQALVDEIGQGARRLKVLDEVEARLREATSYSNVNPELVVWKQARLAAEGLNSYINWLGLSPLKLDRRGRTVSIRGHEALLFEPPEPPGEIPQLPDQQGLYDLPYFQDWARAFHRLMIHNVDFAEKTYDPEQNARLGAVLKGVSGVREAWR